MAKKPAKKPRPPAADPPPPAAPPDEVIDPHRVHELFGLPGPYDPGKPPPTLPGYATIWDPGVSIATVRAKFRDLFYHDTWAGHRFARATDQWRWRQIKVSPIEPGKPYEEQLKKLPKGDEVASAREVVAYLALRFLATGDRLETTRLRCRETLDSGRRVIVGPFHPLGLDLATVSDDWVSPGIGLAAVFTPAPRRR
jgi:hypothetical protein